MTVVEAPPAAETIDPRIRARREEVQRARQVRRRRWFIGFAIALSVVSSSWFVTRTALLDVDQIQVAGSTHTTDDEVRAASGVAVGDQILDVDGGAIRARLLALPWVADASVESSWSGDVVLRIREREPVAMFTDAEARAVLVDGEGRVLAVAALPDADLVAVQGVAAGAPGEHVADSDGALAVINAMTPSLRSRVETLVVAPEGQIELKARPSGVVWFGEATEIDAKVRSLQGWFARVDDRGLATLDVRVPDRPTATRLPGTPPAGASVG
jgi:cell division protein FtsQ